MDPPESRRSTKCTKVCAVGNSHACFASVIEIVSQIIVGVQAKKPMSASTERNSKKRISGTQDEGMGSLEPIRAFSDGYQSEFIEHSLMDMLS